MYKIPFSAPYSEPAGSPIRELFPFLSRPGMISLAGGYPSAGLFDQVGLQQACLRAMESPGQSLQYCATEGLPALRERLKEVSSARGVHCELEQLIVTTGSQQAFDLLVRVLVEPGNCVYVESPTYPATLQALRLAQSKIVQIPMDAMGIRIDALEAMLAKAPSDERPKLLYTVPNFSNPAGTLLPRERREALVQLALRYGFLIVEDDPYGALDFGSGTPPTLFELAGELAPDRNPVLYLSSLSKTVAPALRIGWMIVPRDVSRRCAIAKQTTDLCSSSLAQMIAAEYLNGGGADVAIEAARKEYGLRMRHMSAALRDQLGERASFVEPAGGMFIWLQTTREFDPKRLFEASVEAGVLFVPGRAFFEADADLHCMRLTYASPDCGQISEGIARLGHAFDAAK
ncbi:PLP-dependent aminotransferase family protein [Variovorax paradoxus]|uniref:aminotransferase-like domain-containing protein n=1 Tax=Variovorax paradoxus TaxID=34073 RepID=UPI00193198E4|nr:PLP-dependent aminotransferase family protein [Variovorax paradoxus]